MKLSGSCWKNSSDDTQRGCGKRRRLGNWDQGWHQPRRSVSPALPRAGSAPAPMQLLQNVPLPFTPRVRALLGELRDGAPDAGETTICSGVNSDCKHYAE